MRVKSSAVNVVCVFGVLLFVICGCKGTSNYYPGIATVKEIVIEKRANSSSDNKNSDAPTPDKPFLRITPTPKNEVESPDDLMRVIVDFVPDDKNVKIGTNPRIQGNTATRKELNDKGIVIDGRYRVTAHHHGTGKMGYFWDIPVKDFQPVR